MVFFGDYFAVIYNVSSLLLGWIIQIISNDPVGYCISEGFVNSIVYSTNKIYSAI